ncbi:fasciclin domain-containing protein [Pedobacter sp. AW31-3R]|uniref:fasciclin domain-containing protein n=1 Tax=Pedobacter sp. AW31-3R TaxID=3445781 RepID=UPI003F9F98D1
MTYKVLRHLYVLLLLTVLTGCKDAWQDHNAVKDTDLSGNLFQKIEQEPSLNSFAALLIQTGFDKVLASSRSYTVWAPQNEAIATLAVEITQDTAKLKQFVAAHISLQSYANKSGLNGQRIETLSGKYITLKTDSVDGARIVKANSYAGNGLLHIIDKAELVKQNIWEFISGTGLAQLQKNYLLSQNYIGFDPSKAVQTGIDPLTGTPVYQSGSGEVNRNYYLDQVADLNDEGKQFTYFLLEDDSYTEEYTRLRPYFNTSEEANPASLTAWRLVKDLAVAGVYPLTSLPDTLLSVGQVKIPLSKTVISATYHLSNGIVHVLKRVGFRLEDKFPALVVQGEAPLGYSRTDKSAVTYFREKRDPSGNSYKDIFIYGHGISQFYISYRLQNVPAAKYKVYWRAIAGNADSQTIAFQQRIAFNLATDTSLPYITVTPNSYTEVLLGEYTADTYGHLDIYLVAAASGTTGQNTLTLDYLKLVPVLD